MTTYKSDPEKTKKIEMIRALMQSPTKEQLKAILNPLVIMWDVNDPASDDNVYVMGNKRVPFEKVDKVFPMRSDQLKP